MVRFQTPITVGNGKSYRSQYGTLFRLNRIRAIDWNRFGDDRMKNNGVSELDHVIGQERMENY